MDKFREGILQCWGDVGERAPAVVVQLDAQDVCVSISYFISHPTGALGSVLSEWLVLIWERYIDTFMIKLIIVPMRRSRGTWGIQWFLLLDSVQENCGFDILHG